MIKFTCSIQNYTYQIFGILEVPVEEVLSIDDFGPNSGHLLVQRHVGRLLLLDQGSDVVLRMDQYMESHSQPNSKVNIVFRSVTYLKFLFRQGLQLFLEEPLEEFVDTAVHMIR